MTQRLTRLLLLSLVAAAMLAGCVDTGGLSMVANDELAQPGQTIHVAVTIRRKGLARWFPAPSQPPLRVYRGNELIQEHQPGASRWSFATEVTLDTPGEHVIDAVFHRRAANKPLSASCHAFCWDGSRVAVAVNFDEVINVTSRLERTMGESPLGEPREDASGTLSAMSREFNICYFTALDASFKDAIRTWLRTNKFPPGPVFHWSPPSKAGLIAGNQAAVLADLQAKAPTLLVGIGASEASFQAFSRAGMLPLIIDTTARLHLPLDVPRLDGWARVWQFVNIDANHAILCDPKTMLDLHYRGGGYVKLSSEPATQ